MCKIHNNALGTVTNGAMAEYINVNADRVHILPDSISFEEGATIEPLCVGIYAVQESGIKMGENAAVYGAGTIGLMTINALKAANANIFVLEPLESKHKLALELGADDVFIPKNWKKIHRLTDRRGPDHVFDYVGIRETIFGTYLRAHVTGGGIKRFIDTFHQSYKIRWKSLETWTEIPKSAIEKVARKELTFDSIY